MARILVIDNYDSFVYTIVDYLRLLGADTTVQRNDEPCPDLAAFDGVLVSPGPGAPAGAGCSLDIIGTCANEGVPMLGVCLGHQALAEYYGASVVHAPELMHGKTSLITHSASGVFAGIESPLEVTRYHSLTVDPATVPDCLKVTASTESGVIMGLEHVQLPLWGVQFHPESVLTKSGHRMFSNWLARCGQTDAVSQAEGKAPLVRAN